MLRTNRMNRRKRKKRERRKERITRKKERKTGTRGEAWRNKAVKKSNQKIILGR